MNWTHRSLWLSLAIAMLPACGGGGGGRAFGPVTPTLVSIALAPLTVSLPPSGTAQLTVAGTYSDGTIQTLTASGETFQTSNAGTATVSASGLVTVAAGAAVGATATISATDTASGDQTSAATSTVVTVVAAGAGPPTGSSVSAAQSTASNNQNCTAIEPFYWEVGDKTATLASGNVGTDATGAPVASTTNVPIASASKWIYGMYVVQVRGGAAKLTPQDINFLHFTSGYTYMGTDTTSATCTAPASGPDSVNACLTLTNSSGEPFDAQNPATTGVFDYDSGHEENHAGQFQPEINALDTSDLGPAIAAGLGLGGAISLNYTQPLLAGGIDGNGADYATILRGVLSGQLGMLDALGTNPVCAWAAGTCNAAYSPVVTLQWHYSIAHWVEDDPTSGDSAFSSPGAFGFYPWIESNKLYYGVISRYAPTGTGLQNGLASQSCGQQIRAAWDSGNPQ